MFSNTPNAFAEKQKNITLTLHSAIQTQPHLGSYSTRVADMFSTGLAHSIHLQGIHSIRRLRFYHPITTIAYKDFLLRYPRRSLILWYLRRLLW